MMRILNLVMCLAFLISVIVQYNDPDPWIWMMVYGLAAAATLLYHFGRLNWLFSAALLLIALIWAAALAPEVLGKVAFFELFEEFEMKSAAVEQAREMGGLLIIAVWMAVLILTIKPWRKG